MAEIHKFCPRCGTEITPYAPLGCCPACLLETAGGHWGDPEVDPPEEEEPIPFLDQTAEEFPQL